MTDLNTTIGRASQISRSVADTFERRLRAALERYATRVKGAGMAAVVPPGKLKTPLDLWQDAWQYGLDSAQRSVLFWDTLRQRGNNYLAHEAAGKPPLLHHEWEMLADARTFERPANYALLRIIPPRGVRVDDTLRPFVIIDPRAGHGPGIGGFKEDSEVGVALKAGHPVYFVIFFPDPEPGQTLADVVDAEAEFVRLVAARHPQSPKPVLVGNCQGGWAVMMLAASQPDIAGPCVINGAPMSYWAGNDAENPMRYAGGLLGGAWINLFAGDLGGGKFDGAHLVSNFENLNPANALWDKYVHLYENIDTEAARFLEFERWWGGFYLFNDAEIRWIVNNLFVGNKLSAGDARLGPGRFFDLKSIKSPIIVFASMGDNITPPQQAFNWIGDLYSSTDEIKAARADDRRPAARGHRPSRHLRLRRGREKGARADRRAPEANPAAAAGPVRDGHQGAPRTPRRERVRRDDRRAHARGPAQVAEVRPRRRETVRGGGRAVRAHRARVRAARPAAGARAVARMARQASPRPASAARAALGDLGQESAALVAAVRGERCPGEPQAATAGQRALRRRKGRHGKRERRARSLS